MKRLQPLPCIILILLAGLTLWSCQKKSEEVPFSNTSCDISNVSYSKTISGIIQNNQCLSCHSGPSPDGGFTLQSYNDVKAKITDGRLLGAIEHLPGYSAMPKGGGKLTDCEINQIKAWISNGTPNN